MSLIIKWIPPIALSVGIFGVYGLEIWQRSYFERDGKMHPITRFLARFVVTEEIARNRRVAFVEREMRRSDAVVHWFEKVAFFGPGYSEKQTRQRMAEEIYRKYRVMRKEESKEE